MKILIDICHPAHAHFFRHPIRLLAERGHDVLVTSRDKDVAVAILEGTGMPHIHLHARRGRGVMGLGRELVQRNLALHRVVRRERPDVMAAIGGTFIAQVGWLTRTPSLVFYDTENARLQNRITYPFATRVIVPRAYRDWLPKNALRYAGYHELSYLHPRGFTPDKCCAKANGLEPGVRNFLIRTVGWDANHDIGESGWTLGLLRETAHYLAGKGNVLISSERPLPDDLSPFAYQGNPGELHHVMAFCDLFVGESATMASESAVLGVPAIYAAHTGRGYTDEQEQRYQLVTNVEALEPQAIRTAIERILVTPKERWAERRQQLLDDTIDVATYVADKIEVFSGDQSAGK